MGAPNGTAVHELPIRTIPPDGNIVYKRMPVERWLQSSEEASNAVQWLPYSGPIPILEDSVVVAQASKEYHTPLTLTSTAHVFFTSSGAPNPSSQDTSPRNNPGAPLSVGELFPMVL